MTATQDIEDDIDGTREEVSRTLDALESKLSPRRRLHAAAESIRHRGERLTRGTLGAVTPDITTMIRMDHTHVLALFRRFKPHTPPGKKRALVRNACLALQIHAQLEEEIFYPALREVVSSEPVLDKSALEHDNMRKLIDTLQRATPGSADYDDTFRKLIREVLPHVADEETTLLPLAEELMPERLGALGMQMTARRLQLLKPHLGEVAATSVRSFPVLTGVLAAGLVWLGWLAIRPRQEKYHGN